MSDVIDVFKKARSTINPLLKRYGLEYKSSGTKTLPLPDSYKLDTKEGYWDLSTGKSVTNKPPRFILHISDDPNHISDDPNQPSLRVDFAKDQHGNLLPGAETIGYINNRTGKAIVVFFRLMPAFRNTPNSTDNYSFIKDWEWLVCLVFKEALPEGSSGEVLSNFNIDDGTVSYKGNLEAEAVTRDISMLGLFTAPPSQSSREVSFSNRSYSYNDITGKLVNFLSSGSIQVKQYQGSESESLSSFQEDIDNILNLQASNNASQSEAVSDVTPESQLLGIPVSTYEMINASLRSGKRHFILYGPPGTGKTTLAEHIANQLSSEEEGYIELTASSDWSSYDLIGGYQPVGSGKIAFVPGVMLQNFDKPIIIDEMNRCPIDKVLGPLFSVLSGQEATLPYRTEVAEPNSPCYRILPKVNAHKESYEFGPGERWSMICTLNQIDKTQLGQLSYALSRRFAWIRIGVPENLDHFIVDYLHRQNLLCADKDYSLPNPVAEMWREVNFIRELGPAPIIDFIKIVKELETNIDFQKNLSGNNELQEFFVDSFAVTIVPLLDGIAMDEANRLLEAICQSWSLEDRLRDKLNLYLSDMAF